jgi:uncharacterized protein
MPILALRIRVKPGSREASLTPMPDGSWEARLKSPPVDGKANAELIALLAEHHGCRKAAVTIKSGQAGRIKLVKISLP